MAKALKEVEQQIIEKKKLIEEKEYAYQQFIKEKLMIEEKLMIKEKLINDKVGRKIFEEDAKVRQIEMEKKREQREYIQGMGRHFSQISRSNTIRTYRVKL